MRWAPVGRKSGPTSWADAKLLRPWVADCSLLVCVQSFGSGSRGDAKGSSCRVHKHDPLGRMHTRYMIHRPYTGSTALQWPLGKFITLRQTCS